jgi:hypothetical protein
MMFQLQRIYTVVTYIYIYLFIYCDMAPERRNSGARETDVAREWFGKLIVSATAVTSRNNRRAAGSNVAALYGARRIVPLQWNMQPPCSSICNNRKFREQVCQYRLQLRLTMTPRWTDWRYTASRKIILTLTGERLRFSPTFTSDQPLIHYGWTIWEAYFKDNPKTDGGKKLTKCESVWLSSTSQYCTSKYDAGGSCYPNFQQ